MANFDIGGMMADTIVTTDPKALEDLLTQVAGLKEMFSNANKLYSNRPTRGKYLDAVKQLKDAELPFITLSRDKFPGESVPSMNAQFKKIAEKHNVGIEPSLVEYNDELLLCDFDAENAGEKFDAYIMSKAGIDASELAAITRELDSATR